MKELIRSNETIEQFSNESLTTRSFHPTLIVGGDIFMAELRGDMAQPKNPTNPNPRNPERIEDVRANPDRKNNVPQKPQRSEKPIPPERVERTNRGWDDWTEKYLEEEGRTQLTFEERQTIEAAKKAGRLPHPVAGGQDEGGERISVEDATRRLEEAGGPGGGGEDIPPAPPVPPEEGPAPNGEGYRINLTGITDPALLSEAGVLQNIINAIPIEQRYEKLIDGFERIALLEGVNPEQKQILIQEVQRAIGDTMRLIQGKRREGLYGERKLLEEEKEQIRRARDPEDKKIEELFNRMFDRVDSRPQVDFNSAFGNDGTFEYAEFMKTIIEEISAQNTEGNLERSRELSAIRDRFSNERSAREIIHNAFFAVISGQNTEAVANYMASFLSGYADLAFSKAGVVQAMHFYEEALLMVREKNGGFLRPKDVIGHIKENSKGEVNMLAEELLREANENGELGVDNEGRPRQLAKWELDRALSFARGMSIIVGNSIEIAATSIIPGVELGGSAFNDLFAQRIIGEIYPFRHTVKFWVGSKFSRPLAYLLDRNKAPWTPKELEEFHKLGLTGQMSEQIKILNDLMPEGQERFYSILNPFEIGGLFSRTGWRIGGDPRNPGETAIKNMLMEPKDRKWIGTGVIIERERGDLEKLGKDPKDVEKGLVSRGRIQEALERTANVTPLKLFLNIREFKEKILTDLLGTHSDFFTMDEKKAIRIKIMGEFKKRENTRKVEEEKEQRLLKKEKDAIKIKEAMEKGKEFKPEDFKLKELSKEEAKKEKSRKRESYRVITSEFIMNDEKFKNSFSSLVLLQERALSAKDEQMVGNQSPLARIIRDTFLNNRIGGGDTYMEAFLQRLQHKGWKVPFIFGTEDIPFNKYVIEDTGPRSVARRWADMQSAAKAGAAFNEFLIGIDHYTKPEQIVENMYKIYTGIFGYNEDFARKFTKQLAEGVMKFYGKSWTHRLPLGIGSLNTLIGGNSSFAQMMYGRDAMAWDELDLNQFTRLLRDRGLLSVEEQHELQKKAGGGKMAASWDVARTVLPLLMIAMAYYMITEASKRERS